MREIERRCARFGWARSTLMVPKWRHSPTLPRWPRPLPSERMHASARLMPEPQSVVGNGREPARGPASPADHTTLYPTRRRQGSTRGLPRIGVGDTSRVAQLRRHHLRANGCRPCRTVGTDRSAVPRQLRRDTIQALSGLPALYAKGKASRYVYIRTSFRRCADVPRGGWR